MTKSRLPTVAIMYDFDGTLSPGNMQEYDFLPQIGEGPETFWKESEELAVKEHMDRVQAYMYLMMKKADNSETKSTKDALAKCGEQITFFPGVQTDKTGLSWFERINTTGKALGLNVEHYIISSGLQEIIEGTPIAKHFEKIYASSFKYNEYGKPIWAARAVNYTTKTQYIFRINKGTLDESDDKSVNKYTKDQERHVPFSRMIYIGDGATDIPCMSLVKSKGGHAIAVYPKNKPHAREKAMAGIGPERFNFLLPADYSENKAIDSVLKAILREIKSTYDVELMEKKYAKGDCR